jgi:hypothetical protein
MESRFRFHFFDAQPRPVHPLIVDMLQFFKAYIFRASLAELSKLNSLSGQANYFKNLMEAKALSLSIN